MPTTRPDADWLSEAKKELGTIAAAASEGLLDPSKPTCGYAASVLDLCAEFPLSEPAVVHDDEGGFELFFKEGNKALLLAVTADHKLQVFGDSKKEQWRAHYSLQGSVWKRYLPTFLQDMITDDPA
jgi:hypothetical protein